MKKNSRRRGGVMEEVKPVFAENPRPLKRPVIIDLTGGEGFTKEELELQAANDLVIYGLGEDDEAAPVVDLPTLYGFLPFFFSRAGLAFVFLSFPRRFHLVAALSGMRCGQSCQRHACRSCFWAGSRLSRFLTRAHVSGITVCGTWTRCPWPRSRRA